MLLLLKQFLTTLNHISARNETRGKTAVEKLKKEFGVCPKYFPLDVTDKATIERLKDHLADTYGGLDILINNAGINQVEQQCDSALAL